MPPAPRRRPPRRPRWRRRPEARPEEILAAALLVFSERGFARARLEEVARRAGVSKGTLYLYYDSKEELFRAVVRAIKGAALAEGEAWLDAYSGSAREALAQLIHRMWQLMADPDQAAVSRLLRSEIPNFPELARFYFNEVVLRARRLLERVLAMGVASGEFRPEQARFAARAIPAMALMLSDHYCHYASFDPQRMAADQLCNGIVDLILNGVLLRPEPRS